MDETYRLLEIVFATLRMRSRKVGHGLSQKELLEEATLIVEGLDPLAVRKLSVNALMDVLEIPIRNFEQRVLPPPESLTEGFRC